MLIVHSRKEQLCLKIIRSDNQTIFVILTSRLSSIFQRYIDWVDAMNYRCPEWNPKLLTTLGTFIP